MSGIKPVFMKEMHKVFKEPKMIFSLFILPVISNLYLYVYPSQTHSPTRFS